MPRVFWLTLMAWDCAELSKPHFFGQEFFALFCPWRSLSVQLHLLSKERAKLRCWKLLVIMLQCVCYLRCSWFNIQSGMSSSKFQCIFWKGLPIVQWAHRVFKGCQHSFDVNTPGAYLIQWYNVFEFSKAKFVIRILCQKSQGKKQVLS